MLLALINATSSSTGALVEDEGSPAIVSAQDATAAGVLQIVRDFSGNVTASAATSSGTVILIVTASGTVTASAAIVAGTVTINAGTVAAIRDYSGVPQAQPASTSATLSILSTVIASVQAQDATANASVFVLGGIDIDAEVFSQDATVVAAFNRGWIKKPRRPRDWTKIYG